ncbi:MAG TPA: CHAT domain-containing protein, partial [Candidatus Polarisedimenticolaceae bacterium]|nr:CHAT domain-containing protein [Candidatus Polarisedimenticolaceae bacterium]
VYWAVDARLALGTPEPMAPYERALPILDERHGPTDERTLQLMSRVADLLFGKRSFREACSVWEEIARRRARIPVSLRRAVDEGALAICLLSAGRLQDATTWRRASRETASEVLRLQPPGDDEARLAAARSLVEIGLFAESSRLVEELMRSNDARVLEHAASLLVSLGKDPAAEGAYRRALAIRESESPPAPRALASVLDALAVTLERAGRDVEALGLAERAVKVVQQFPLETATLRGAVLSTRAQVRLRLGDADGAGKDLETAFLAARAGEGAGASTAELSLTCLELRDSRGASPCVAILDRIPAAPASRQPFGYSDEMIGVRLVRAAYQLDAGRSDDARRAMADVLHELRPIRSSRVRRQHPILGELVEPLEAAIRGDATAARDVERRLVARRRGRIPRASPGELRLVGVLGEGLVAAGFPGAAAELCRYLDRIVAESYGDDHPERIRYRAAEARYEWQAGRTEVAVDAATAAVDASTRYIRDALELLPEAQALELVRAVPAAEEILFSELVRPPSGRSRASACWAWVLSRRALVLDELAERRRSPAGSAELVAVRRQLATLWVRGPSSDDAEAYRTELDRLIAERDEAERSLAETSDVFRRKQALRSPKLDSVARALPEDGALVEFVRVRIATAGRGDWGERYVALILTAGSRSPEYVDLGPAARLESLIESWKRAVIDSFAPNGIGLRSVDELDAEGRKLRESVWDPIAAKLGEVKVVFMVPDGALQGLSFAALPSENGYLIEHGPAIHTLSTGRDLVRLTSSGASPSPGSGALAAGAPDFAAVAAVEPSPVQEDAAKSVRGSTTACRELWAVKWDALPGAEEELRRIGEQLAQRGPTLVLEHDQATEERFAKEAPKRRVIHIATHAYQWDEGCRRESSTAGARNPLLLSGLVLAGANQANRSVNDSQDGLLTAEEVSLLDLRGTQLVTLSACETGAGTVWEEEGVIGLRRAFEIAGARTVLSSLWPVPDREAAEWMLAFYESLHAGKPVVDAVRSASLAMLERLRKQERPAHPYYWANFSAAGDWR